MNQDKERYIKALLKWQIDVAKWVADEIKRSVAGSGGGVTTFDDPGSSPPPPPPPPNYGEG